MRVRGPARGNQPQRETPPQHAFDAPDGWFFSLRTYTFALTAQRVVPSEPVRGMFSVTLSAENLAFLDTPGSDQFLAFPLRGR